MTRRPEPSSSATPGMLGVGMGALGVLAFSWTAPFTRMAVTGGLSPTFVASGRALIAGLLAVGVLAVTRQRVPRLRHLPAIATVAAGCVVGFPVLTSIAARTVPASHIAMVIGLVPLATAACSVVRTREYVPPTFWVASIGGAAAVMAFVGVDDGGFGRLDLGDLELLGAVVSAGVGYAEGGILARQVGAWQTICWALVLVLPAAAVVTAYNPPSSTALTPRTVTSFGYLAVVSMFLAFFAWYRGLAIGPIARVSQIQLVQPPLSMLWATLVLGERPRAALVAGVGVGVVAAAAAIRARGPRPAPSGAVRAPGAGDAAGATTRRSAAGDAR